MKNFCKILCALVLAATLALSLASCDLSSLFGTPDCGEGNHVWSQEPTIVTAAACEQNATGYYICTVCEKQSDTAELPETALEHTWSADYTEATPAECEKDATGYKTCTVCNTKGNTVALKDTALGHTWGDEYFETTPATCITLAKGYKLCTVCDAKDEENLVDIPNSLVAHTWSEDYTFETAPQCGVDGIGYKTCTVTGCTAKDETVTVTGSALVHKYTVEKVDDAYRADEAETPHDYYKSCEYCGAASPDEKFAVHTYNQNVVKAEWLATEATTAAPAAYYKSCVCGLVSETETFAYGYALYAAGTGVYYNKPGDYTVTKNAWDAIEATDYVMRSGSTAPSVADGTLKVPFDKYAHYLFNNKNIVVGTQHIVETDIMIEKVVTLPRTDGNRFAALTITAGENGAMSKAFIVIYLHSYDDADGNPVIELTAEGTKSNVGAPYTIAIVDANEWFNLRVEATETFDEATGATTAVTYNVYVNGTLAAENYTKGTNASKAAKKLTGIGFEVSGACGSNIYLDNTVFGTVSEVPIIPEFVAGTGVYWADNTIEGYRHNYVYDETLTIFNHNQIWAKSNWKTNSDAGSAGKITLDDTGVLKLHAKGGWGVVQIRNRAASSDEVPVGTKHVFETDLKVSNITQEAGKRIGMFAMVNQSWYDAGTGAARGFFYTYLATVTDENGNVGLALSTTSGGEAAGNFFTFNSGESYNLRIEVEEVKGVSVTATIYVNGVKVISGDGAGITQLAHWKNGEIYAEEKFGGIVLETSGDCKEMDIELWNTFANTFAE